MRNKRANRFRGKSGTEEGKKQPQRITLLLVFLAFLFLPMFCRIWELQIVNGKKYAKDYELRVTKTVRDSHARGKIYDRNGKVLAYNELVYTVTMTEDGAYSSSRERQLALNGMVYCMVKKLKEHGEQLNNELSIRIGAGGKYEYTVEGEALLRFKADVFGKANPEDLGQEQEGMGAEEMVTYLSSSQKFALFGEGKKGEYSKEEREAYGLPEEFSKEELLAVTGIRYMLSLHSYQKYVPIVLARDVSEKTVAYVRENSDALEGVHIGQEYQRVYEGGSAFSHILGYTGKISPEELEQEGSGGEYDSESVVGKAGLEQYLEDILRGSDGERRITVNNVGRVVGEDEVFKETASGRDVTLSIDKDLQAAIYKILEQNLAGIVTSNLVNEKGFDKSKISDASDIRIPIYDVYLALAENGVISLEKLGSPDASELEQVIAGKLKAKEEEARRAIRAELLEGEEGFGGLPAELQEYLTYLVHGMGLLEEDAGSEDSIYQEWEKEGDISPKEFLTYALSRGWVSDGFLESGQGYLTNEERYALLVEEAGRKLEGDGEFQKLAFRWLVLEDEVTGKEICQLLYEQQVFPEPDGDYEALMSGKEDAFSFLKKKIEHLEITPAQLALDPCSASAVAVDPTTGKVLALVSYPGYDNSRLANQMDGAYYQKLLADRSLPLYNRATQQLTAPGSTLKPVTIIAGLQEGVVDPETSVLCDGVFDKVAPSLRCWKHSGHGMVADVPAALQFSCNDYMCEIAYRLGMGSSTEYKDSAALECLKKYAGLFHLEQKSGIEVAESSPHVTDAYGIPSAIGQGTHNYATVQLARYAGALASKGDIFSLSLIQGVAGADGEFQETEASLEGRVELPGRVWEAVSAGMVQFAQNNQVLKNMGIPVAGKTGTAQEAKNRPDHALFIGYAPADAPELAIAVRIANGYGSSNATAAGKHIFDYYFGLESQGDILTGEASEAFNTRTD